MRTDKELAAEVKARAWYLDYPGDKGALWWRGKGQTLEGGYMTARECLRHDGVEYVE